MSPLNDFLASQKESLFRFFDEVVDVPSPDVALEVDKYAMVLKQANIRIQISLNELYFIHNLLLSHLNDLHLDPEDPIVNVLRSLGESPKQLPRAENASIDLQLWSNNAADMSGLDPMNHDSESTGGKSLSELYAETKHMLCTVMRRQPALQMIETSQSLLSALTEAKQYSTEDEMSKLVQTLMQNIAKLTALNVLNESDNFARLRKDVATLLSHHSSPSPTPKLQSI